MNREKLDAQRALWVSKLKRELEPEFTVKPHLNDYATHLMVTHGEVPTWRAKVSVVTESPGRNTLRLDDQYFASSVDSHQRQRLIRLLKVLLEETFRHDKHTLSAQRQDAGWLRRQAAETASLPAFRGLHYEIITEGPRAGNYRVSFTDGHPLEYLNLNELTALYTLAALRTDR